MTHLKSALLATALFAISATPAVAQSDTHAEFDAHMKKHAEKMDRSKMSPEEFNDHMKMHAEKMMQKEFARTETSSLKPQNKKVVTTQTAVVKTEKSSPDTDFNMLMREHAEKMGPKSTDHKSFNKHMKKHAEKAKASLMDAEAFNAHMKTHAEILMKMKTPQAAAMTAPTNAAIVTSAPTMDMAPAACPEGTTAQPDGSCMMN